MPIFVKNKTARRVYAAPEQNAMENKVPSTPNWGTAQGFRSDEHTEER
jgi:hypothetical protein